MEWAKSKEDKAMLRKAIRERRYPTFLKIGRGTKKLAGNAARKTKEVTVHTAKKVAGLIRQRRP
jgi:hypothetical protein